MIILLALAKIKYSISKGLFLVLISKYIFRCSLKNSSCSLSRGFSIASYLVNLIDIFFQLLIILLIVDFFNKKL